MAQWWYLFLLLMIQTVGKAKHESYIGQDRETLALKALLHLNAAVHVQVRLAHVHLCLQEAKTKNFNSRLQF